jgi:heat shock protein HslJ
MRFRSAFAALAVAAVVAGCATPPPPPAPTGPITYRLVTIQGASPAYGGVTLRIDGPRANGSTGCNTYLATHDPADGAARPFGWFQVTRSVCTEPQMELERRFLGVLDETRRVERQGADLVLRDGAGGELARLTPQNTPVS